MAEPPPTSSAEALVPSTTALLTAVASTNESLRQILLDTASSSREAIAGLSRELNQIQTAGRLLVRHASAPDADTGLPDAVIAALESILTQTTQLVGIANQVLETNSSDASPLGNIRTLLETARIAINAGVDALSFTPSVEGSSEFDLPSYQSTQLLQDTLNLRLRVMGLSDSITSTFDELKPAIIDFADSLQTHIEETTGTLLVPPPGAEAGQSGTISDAASLHSVHNPALLSPAYSPILVNHPAPSHIGLSHVSKRDVGNNEVYSLAYPQLPGYGHTIAAMLGTQPTRIIAHLDSNSAGQQHPAFEASYHAVFSLPVGQTSLCAYVATFHDQLSSPRHDSSRFVSESYVIVHDLRSGSRVQKYIFDDAKPLCFSPNGEFLLMLGPRNRLGLFTMEQGKYNRTPTFITSHTDTVTHAMYTPDSHAIVTLCVDGTIRMTDSQNYETLAKLDTGATKKPLLLGICPDSDLIVAIFGDTLYRWHHPTGALDSYDISTRRGREGVPLAISPDCRFLACRVDNGVDITDLHKGIIMFTIRFQSGFATAAVFSQDSHSLAIAKAVQWNGMRTTRSTLDLWHVDF